MLQKVLDAKEVLRKTPDVDELSVTLKDKSPYGTGLFATKPIPKGKTIALYRMRVNGTDVPSTPYTFHVYTKSENRSRNLMGNLFEESVPPPKKGIPYWAHFVNEPGPRETPNAYIDINTKGNYKNRQILKRGDIIEYELVAARNIKPREQVFWCYGDNYHIRDYATSCST